MSGLTVIIARHGEKVGGTFPGPGLTPEGAEDEKSLVVRGWQRAGAWAAVFAAGLGDFPVPNVVYGAAPRQLSKEASFSHRPFETAGPTASRFGLKLRADWCVGQEVELVTEVLRLTGVVVIFWEHKAICKVIVPALCAGQAIPGVPLKWDNDRFDVALRFDRAFPAAPWSFRQLAPRLLSGDTDAPFAKRRL